MYVGKLQKITPQQCERFGSLMTAAFLADPAARYIWSGAHQFMSVFPEYSLLYQGAAIANNTAWATEDFSAAIAWLAPGQLPDGDKIFDLAMSTCDKGKQEEVARFFHEVESYFPDEPCWYLPIVGVDPAYLGRGIGHFLMEESLKFVDEEKQAAYLESSNPRNIKFYREFGFEPLGQIELGGKALSTPMFRKPAA